MPHDLLTEEPLRFGEEGRVFGILTVPRVAPAAARALPTFILFNAGLLHRVGPRGLYVRLVRELARMGFSAVRVDLAGRGDSPGVSGLTEQEAVEADYKAIVDVLESRLGPLQLVLGGLCSGADDAIRLAPIDPRVIGMFLIDPVCNRDPGFRVRAIVRKYTNASRYRAWLKRRMKALMKPRRRRDKADDYLELRNFPTQQQLRAAFESIRERRGRVLSVFTDYARLYYNQQGQMGRVLGVEGYGQFCSELFWPQAEHTFPIDLDRRRLIEVIKSWVAEYIREGD